MNTPLPQDFFGFKDYKQLIREALRHKRIKTPAFTFALIAEKLDLQASYVSRVMNSPHTHFSEDHLYRIFKLLDLTPAETEFGFLLRAAQSTSLPERREEILTLIEQRRVCRNLHAIPSLRGELERLVAMVDRLNAPVPPAR